MGISVLRAAVVAIVLGICAGLVLVQVERVGSDVRALVSGERP